MDFIFVVLTYNQENLVLETLNSIKYQVQKYSKCYNVKLIIIDDCSSDDTLKKITNWKKNNQNLFFYINVIENKTNKGTVYCFNYALKLFGNERFKVIAGDDVFASTSNIFEECEKLNTKQLSTYVKMYLSNSKVYYLKKDAIKFYFNMKKKLYHSYNLKEFKKGCYLHTPSTIFLKSTYDLGECEKFNSKFRIFEDDPTWYSMIKNIPDLRISFIDKVIVLYRMHNNSISNGNNANNYFKQELKKLHSVYISDSIIIDKLLLKIRYTNTFMKYISKIFDNLTYSIKYLLTFFDNDFKIFIKKLDYIKVIEQNYFDVYIKN